MQLFTTGNKHGWIPPFCAPALGSKLLPSIVLPLCIATGFAAWTPDVAAANVTVRAKFEPSGDNVYHGVSLPGTWNDGHLQAQLQQYQAFTGKRTAVVTWFASFYDNGRLTSWRKNYAPDLDRVRRQGAISLIKFSVQDCAYAQTQQMADLKQIVRGSYDAYFEEMADVMRDFGSPLFLSINHEMNGDWFPYSAAYHGSGVTADDYVASWRYIVDIFRRRGAGNVAFVWSPNVQDVGAVPATAYYPGDDYVDWVGLSFYSNSGHPIKKLDPVYDTYAARKPIFITEWATSVLKSEDPGFQDEAQWIEDFFEALNTRYPRIKAISWFQWDKEDGNFLLQRLPQQQQAYTANISHPRYLDSADELLHLRLPMGLLTPLPAPPTPLPTPMGDMLTSVLPVATHPLEKHPVIKHVVTARSATERPAVPHQTHPTVIASGPAVLAARGGRPFDRRRLRLKVLPPRK